MRNILIYRTDLLPASETFIAAQAGALRRYSPWFAGLRCDPRSLPLDPTRVRTLTDKDHLRDKLLRRAYLHHGFAHRFHRSLRALRPMLIHAHFAVDACVALALKQQLRVPLIVTLHGYDVTRSDEALSRTTLGRVHLSRKQTLMHDAALFICVSENIRLRALERGYPPEKLVVMRVGIELPQPMYGDPLQNLTPTGGARNSQPIVLFVGRMVEKKGCIHLLRAMERVQASLPAAELVLLGDGPLREGLEREAHARLRNTAFVGMQPPCEVRRWMQQARVLAAPSIVAGDGDSEGLPTVLCEAQAMGLPIVSFLGPGVNEAVAANETALLVGPGDEQALGEAILRLLIDLPLHDSFAAAGRRRAADLFDIRRQTALLEEHYDEVVCQSEWARDTAL